MCYQFNNYEALSVHANASDLHLYVDCLVLCLIFQNWYSLSKTLAEWEALEFARRNGLDLVTVCPTLILGPILQSTVNASTLVLIKLLKGTYF